MLERKEEREREREGEAICSYLRLCLFVSFFAYVRGGKFCTRFKKYSNKRVVRSTNIHVWREFRYATVDLTESSA